MKRALFTLILFLIISGLSFGQLSGPKYIPGDYGTIREAIADLNVKGVAAPGVTFNVTAGGSETFLSPTNGLISLPAGFQSSATAPVVFQVSGEGTNYLVTAATGTGVYDYIFCLSGSDYITFNRIDIRENALNTSGATQMEWGFALLRTSGTDGAQHNTIANSHITMTKTNAASIAIYSANVTLAAPSVTLTVTSLEGENSYNKFSGLTITNVYTGISLTGYNDTGLKFYYDQFNDIGSDGANAISNLGGGGIAPYGIFSIYQDNLTIANTTISGVASTTSSTIAFYGINASTTANGNLDLHHNTVSIQYGGIGPFHAIYVTMGSAGSGNTISIHDNLITGCTYATAGNVACNMLFSDNGGCTNLNVFNNQITNNTFGSATATAQGTIQYMYTRTGLAGNAVIQGNLNVYGNSVTGNVRLQSANVSAGTTYISPGGYGLVMNCYNNTISNNSTSSAGTVNALYVLASQNQKTIYGNTISNLSCNGSMYGIYTGNGGPTSVYNNKIQNLTANNATGLIYGINLSGQSTLGDMYVYNNYVSELKAPISSSTSVSVYGINLSGGSVNTLGCYYNTIYLNATSTGTNFNTAGFYVGTSAQSYDLRNNIVVNASTPNGTGKAVAIRFSATGFANFGLATNNNNYYAGTPGPSRVIFFDGTNSAMTLADYKTLVTPRELQSVTENPPFINVATSPYDLHLKTDVATQCESAGTILTTPLNVTNDYDNDARYPNAGYPDNPGYPAMAPDLGADEFGGIPNDLTPPSIVYTPLMNTSSLENRTLIATISDGHGVPTSGTGLPQICWKRNSAGAWTYVQGTSIGSDKYSFSFGGGVATIDTIYYFVVAQDNYVTPNAGTYPIVGASGFTINPPACSTSPATPYKYYIIPSICGTYTVGVGQNYQTLTEAINDINNKEISCPVTLLLTDNNYPGEYLPMILNQNPGSSAVNTLTIKPAPGATPVFDYSYLGTYATGSRSLITLNGVQHVTFDGSNTVGGSDRSLTLKNTASSGFAAPIGLYNNGTVPASNITVKNCVLQAHQEMVYNAQGIVLYSISGNAGFTNIVIDNNEINSAAVGIQLGGAVSGPANNIRITNNTIGSMTATKNVMNRGIVLSSYCNNVLIEGNEIIGPVTGNTIFPQSIMGVMVNPYVTNLKISKNIIHDWYGISSGPLGIYYSAEATSITEISNNVMYNIFGAGSNTGINAQNPYGILVFSGGNMRIHHNSISLSGSFLSATTPVISSCIAIWGNGSTNIITGMDIRDNILKNSMQPSSGTPASKTYAIVTNTPTCFSALDNNDYFINGVGPNIGMINGTDQATLLGWQGVTGMDRNTLTIDPLFTDANYLLPTESTLNNKGIYLSSVPTDITNVLRTNPPDMGAYEFIAHPIVTTVNATDIALTSAFIYGTVNALNDTVNTYFDYGLTTAYGTSVSGDPTSITGSTVLFMVATVSGLEPGTTYHFRARGVTNTGLTIYGDDMTFTTLTGNKILNVKAFLEGFFDMGSGMMNKAQTVTPDGVTQFDKWPSNHADTLSIELAQGSEPWPVVFQAHGLFINTDGMISTNSIPPSLSGDYYIVVKHRQSVETWSRLPVSFTGTTISYDFTTAASQAFGNNQKILDEGGPYGFWAGDVTSMTGVQDGYIDIFDNNDVFNLSQAAGHGYIIQDLTGFAPAGGTGPDGFVDIFDMALVFNNMQQAIGMITPPNPGKK